MNKFFSNSFKMLRDRPALAVVGVCALVFTIALLFSLLIPHFQNDQHQKIMDRHIELEKLISDVIYLDQVLTLSCRTEVLTGEKKWEDQYLKAEVKLNWTLKQLSQLGSEYIKEALSKIIHANDQLTLIEKRAFSLSQSGNRKRAQDLVTEKKYISEKEKYSYAVSEVLDSNALELRHFWDKERRSSETLLIYYGIGILILIIFWVWIIGMVNNFSQIIINSLRETLGIIAHDLRSPNATIQQMVQLLSQMKVEELESDGKAICIKLDKICNTNRALLNSYLSMAQIQKGSFELQLEKCDLREIVQHSIDAIESNFIDAEVTFDLQLGPIPIYVFVDSAKIQEIFINILSNACKYSPKSTVSLVLTQEGNNSVVKISDKGAGIAIENIDAIFDSYFTTKGSNSDRRSLGSLGLGLAISKKIAKLHKGDISVHSILGEGSTFSIVLPIN